MGNMDDRDFETYMELFEQMMTIVRLPDLMIYLRSSVPHLVDNIHKRGRDYEQTMPLKYLSNLNELYEEFVMNTYKGRKLVIDVDTRTTPRTLPLSSTKSTPRCSASSDRLIS